MRIPLFPIIGIFLVASCTAAELNASQKSAIGKKIWQNECAGTVNGLTTWNAGEEFPSLGIGHFIWYPAGFNGRFNETWPQFVAFAKQQGAALPAVALERHSPWKTKAEFQKDFMGGLMTSVIIPGIDRQRNKLIAAITMPGVQ